MGVSLWTSLALSTLLLTATATPTTDKLNAFLKHYEPVNYDLDQLTDHHHQLTQRSDPDRFMRLKFSALGRSFDLVLKPDPSVFHDSLASRPHLQHLNLQHSTYSGHDRKSPGSRVHGSMISGVFDGIVYTDEDVYYIEPAHRYTRDISFHTIIYRQSDLDVEALQGARCGVDSGSSGTTHRPTPLLHQTNTKLDQRTVSNGNNGARKKRQSQNFVRCDFNITGDYKFFREVTSTVSGTAVKERVAMSILIGYVRGASEVFRGADFDLDGDPDNIQFGVRDVVVETEKPQVPPFNSEFIGVEAYLRHHSNEPSDEFCLSYRFTYRDFDGGVLGLAYVAARNGGGGICRTTQNTGIVTLLNFGRRVPTAVSVLTLAHEAGHNFGSEHDPVTGRDECNPEEDEGGKFIMYAFANSGRDNNNNRFSECSSEMIGPIIANRAATTDPECFRDANDLCQNGILDANEQCDCGIDYDDSTGICKNDPCCNGMTCNLTSSSDCSPDQGDCCDPNTCSFFSTSRQCAMEDDCSLSVFCNGTAASCPEAVAKTPSGNLSYILCNGGDATCVGNTCNGSFCEVLGAESCNCMEKDLSCHVCCVIDDECQSTTANPDVMAILPDGMGRFLPVGSPCEGDGFIGLCDNLNNCFRVDNNGALSRLADIFLNTPFDLNAVLREYWWAFLASIIGILIGAFLIVLIVHILIPRPEHVQKRAQRRRSIRRNRSQKHHAHVKKEKKLAPGGQNVNTSKL